MQSKDYTILILVVATVLFCLSIPIWYHSDDTKEDVYVYQGFNDSDVTEVNKMDPMYELGKYRMTFTPCKTAEVSLKDKYSYSKIPFIVPGKMWDPEHIGTAVLDKGTTYTLYLNERITDSQYHFILHTKE